MLLTVESEGVFNIERNFTLDAFICYTTKFERRSLNVYMNYN